MLKWFNNDLYLFRSRVLTHVVFWFGYYIFFGLAGTENGDLFKSFEREFVAMPSRIGAGYVTLYYLIPRLLLKEKYLLFLIGYLGLIGVALVGQRLSCFYFHECFFMEDEKLLVPALFQQAFFDLILITALLSAVKLFKIWRTTKQHGMEEETPLKIKAEKRFHNVLPSSVLYIEGMGNYITFTLEKNRRLIAYMSLKEAEQLLPERFKRIHKSFIINPNKIESYNSENVEIAGRIIPVGKSHQL